MRALGFKIWYSDTYVVGTTYEHWVNSPDDDVQQVLVFFGDVYRQVAVGNDYYGLDEAMELMQGDNLGEMHGHIKRGAMTTDANLERILQDTADSYEVK